MDAVAWKQSINQNIVGLIVSLIALGVAEYYKLYTLFVFSFLLLCVFSLSTFICLVAYTINYWNKKLGKVQR